jgi:hypothetical protein
VSSNLKHIERSHRGYRNKFHAFSGFYYHAPKGFRRIELSKHSLLRKLFGWFNVAR